MPDILGRLRSPRLAGAPATPQPGEMYYNSTSNVLYYWNGTSWVTSGATGGGIPVLAAAVVSDVGVLGQIRAGRQLTAADFTALGLSAPRGLWNLSDLTDASGNGRALTNKGAVPFGPGINGLASTAAVFSGSTAQALYISDTGAGDPFRISTGSIGCWFRNAKRAIAMDLITKRLSGTQLAYDLLISNNNVAVFWVSVDGTTAPVVVSSVSDVNDDRWHFVVVTFDGATLRLSVDGVLEGANSLAGTIFPAAAPFNIGAEIADGATAAGAPCYGRIDEAFVTADVLSDDQVRALYCAKIAHGFAGTPSVLNLAVRRARKGGPYATTDFPTQPLRLHNFTAGVLTDQGSNSVALTNNNAALSVVGADGAQGGAYNFIAASSQSLSATDAGLPAGTAARSLGAWFKTTFAGSEVVLGWGTTGSADARLLVGYPVGTAIGSMSGADGISGPYVADGQWHFGVVVEDNAAGDGVKRKLYCDGRLVAGSTVLNPITLAGANRMRVSGNQDASAAFFTGQIDGAFVCGYALTQDQISTLYAKGSQQLPSSVKNAGDHIEYTDATNIYATFDTLDTQNAIDLAVTG